MRPGDAPAAPSSANDPPAEDTPAPPASRGSEGSEGSDETPAPGSTDDELSVPIRRGNAAAKARRDGSWGAVDGAVGVLALAVMALSLAAAWWLFGR
jgi:hypothetical protein